MFKSACTACFMMITAGVAFGAEADTRPLPANSMPRVRPHDSRSAALLLRGIERSATIRQLVSRLETMDVIVYVEIQPALGRKIGGSLVWLTAAGNFRYVRVSINPNLAVEVQVSTLGHELQHALEVAITPSIMDEASLESFYRKTGINMRSHDSGWDTQAARDTGELVRRELSHGPGWRAVESVQPFDPLQWHIVYRKARDKFNH